MAFDRPQNPPPGAVQCEVFWSGLVDLCFINDRHVGIMQPHPHPSELTCQEQRMRAVQYRQMAATASTTTIRDALIRLAEGYERIAKGPPGYPITLRAKSAARASGRTAGTHFALAADFRW
jgi:hypothetical protein